MNRMKGFVCAVVVAMVMGFVSSASAQEEDGAALEDQIAVSFDEAPYVDAEGIVDYEMAKDYAELVESYVDEDGTKWEVWLDEFGGHMWTEYMTEDGILGDEELFVPYYVVVYYSGGYAYYTVSGTTCGHIEYVGSCGTRCYKWNLCFEGTERGCSPYDVTEIAARATSDSDYCDGYYFGYYADPAIQLWYLAEDYDCWTVGGANSYYDLDDTGPNGLGDYNATDKMVRWRYRINGDDYYTDVYSIGACIF